ncbi:DUF72 domain-containing protein [Phenylobacterium deserti]|uniref:DUF72 domain-containing protein n=1 Tax=Phenylobacterium deserti TaxID=1914756 RepID=A0A328AZ38_9CAUL|nr:DUF72 domain-containing protein [Phenylobacterium deserti]RAK58088.1 DUF72 domain-containing protein [Phenylobacterium deserti]
MAPRVRIATAGWAIPRAVAEQFPAEGSGLERYAGRFDAVEINSTFYRSHRTSTYERWAAQTPAHFRFALKLPRAITHAARLVDADAALAAFRVEAEPLGDKLGPLLVQLPPSLVFEAPLAKRFWTALREHWSGPVVCEPRHASWFEADADAMLAGFRVARAAADPALSEAAARPGGWSGLAYWRWHGSPRMYYSAYDETQLQALASELQVRPGEVWCVFDNTTSGAAAANALDLQARVAAGLLHATESRAASE